MYEFGQQLERLHGRLMTDAEAQELTRRLPLDAGWIIALMRRYPLIEQVFTLPSELDSSGLGVDLRWMTPEDIVRESFDFYPGIAAIKCGYVPIGTCLRGSGDPYFLKAEVEDAPLVRIPHDSVDGEMNIADSMIEVVCPTLSQFFAIAQIA